PLPPEAGEVQFDPDSCPWRDRVEERELWDTGFEVVRVWAAYRLPETYQTPGGRPRWVCYSWDAFESEWPDYENPWREVSPEELRQALHQLRRPLPKELAEVGADLPIERKAPAPPLERPNDARDKWMTDRWLAGASLEQIQMELTDHQKWKPISTQRIHKAIRNYYKRTYGDPLPRRRKEKSPRPPRVINPERLINVDEICLTSTSSFAKISFVGLTITHPTEEPSCPLICRLSPSTS